MNVNITRRCFATCAKIIETKSLSPVSDKIAKLGKDALVVWDVDGTLIVPRSRLAFESYYRNVREIGAKICSEKGSEFKKKWDNNIYHSLLFQKVGQQVIDPISVTLINHLREQKIRTIALTALSRGEFGQISDVVEWRINQLRELGFNFLPPNKESYCFQFKYLNIKNSLPAYRNGVLFSSNLPKGIILKEFYKRIEFSPSEVVFIDDRRDHVESITNEMEKERIPTTSFHYTAVHKDHGPLDLKMAETQMKHLIETGILLSDEELKRVV